MTGKDIAGLYRTGVVAATEKMAERVGAEAAERWKRACIAQSRLYAENVERVLRRPGRAP